MFAAVDAAVWGLLCSSSHDASAATSVSPFFVRMGRVVDFHVWFDRWGWDLAPLTVHRVDRRLPQFFGPLHSLRALVSGTEVWVLRPLGGVPLQQVLLSGDRPVNSMRADALTKTPSPRRKRRYVLAPTIQVALYSVFIFSSNTGLKRSPPLNPSKQTEQGEI